jgi:hypothetical protein
VAYAAGGHLDHHFAGAGCIDQDVFDPHGAAVAAVDDGLGFHLHFSWISLERKLKG